ncbi:MAG: hypothetical protein MNPFHGCM_02014 [Gemmatimonadaceae bacterium]|nr:hypothetical protein [Gemmatimonadaceae bacterium]
MGSRMTPDTDTQDTFVTTINVDSRTYDVTLAVEHDGIEHVGRLWFTDTEWAEDEGVRDHGVFPGRSPNDVVSAVRALSESDLRLRYRRAVADRRKYYGLRKITEDVLGDIRHLNKVATSMRAGLLQLDEAAEEIAQTERRLHEMISQLRHFAGVATA